MLADSDTDLDNSAAEKNAATATGRLFATVVLKGLCCVGGSDISEEPYAGISPEAAAEPISMDAAVRIHMDPK